MMNLEALIALFTTLFPANVFGGLIEEIKKSLRVPQAGKYHNEGLRMWRHLVAMYENAQTVMSGDLTKVPGEMVARFQAMIGVISIEDVLRYIGTHDLGKMMFDLTYSNGQSETVTIGQWDAMIKPQVAAADGDEDEAVRLTCEKYGIVEIQYLGHEDRSAEMLAAYPQLSPVIVHAVAHHGTGYNMSRVSVDTYRKHWGELDRAGQDFCLLVAYIDTAASWREGGEPYFANLVFMFRSRVASEYLTELTGRLAAQKDLTKHLLTGELDKIRKSATAFESETVEQAFARIVKAATPASFDTTKVAAALGAFPELSAEDKTAIVANPGDAGKLVGKKLGKKAGELKAALAACQL